VRMISGEFDTKLAELNREEVSSIDKLPNEVLLEVFALLDSGSLLNACLVCKSWENLIGASAVTMNKFFLYLNPPRVKEKFDGSSYWRKHVELAFCYGDAFNSLATSMEHFDVTHVKKIRSHGEEVEIQKMMEFLSQMPLVQEIDIEFLISYASAPLAEVVTFPHLRVLKIGNAMCDALQFFNARLLTDLNINLGPLSDQDMTTLEKFLEISENLKTLEFNAGVFTRIFGKETQPQFKFNLEKFEMSYHCVSDALCDRNFNKFLRTQSNLKELAVFSLYNLSTVTFATIVALPKLKHLEHRVSSTPSSRQFFEKLRPNTSVKTLQINGNFPSDEAAKGFFKSFPNVELIQLQGDIGDHINYVAMYNKRLVELQLSSITSQVFDESTFDNLKSIKINCMRNTKAWMSLVDKSPSLRTLNLRLVEDKKILRPEVEFLLRQPCLRNLKLDGEYESIKINVFDVLKENYGRLKSLDLSLWQADDFEIGLTTEVQFEFPDDVSQWSIEAAEAKLENTWKDWMDWKAE
jgi:hypothetical protein